MYKRLLSYRVSENPLQNQRWFQTLSFIYSANIYWAPTLFQALSSAMQVGQRWRNIFPYYQGLRTVSGN